MICKGPLTAEQMRSSRKYYNLFNLVNGFSYMCLGETVVILLAVTINVPDYVVSAIGGMIYFGYLLLPLGKIMTARVGAAKSQADFWVLRNFAAVCVGSASFAALVSKPLAIFLLLAGTFIFYGFRAAGVVMSQPLVGEICEPEKRADLLAFSNVLFYSTGVLSLLVIYFLLHIHTSVWMLTGIIYAGALLGVTASFFIRRIDETEALRESAKKPLLHELKGVLAIKPYRRMLLAGFSVYLSIIMLVPTSMLALKRGYGVHDTEALVYSLIQFSGAVAGSYLTGKITGLIGPRKTLLCIYFFQLLIAVFWGMAPAELSGKVTWFVFFAGGACPISMGNTLVHYFLMSVEPEKRVAGSLFSALVMSAGAGVAGVFLSGALLKWTASINASGPALDNYRLYFIFSGILMGIAAIPVLRLITVIDDFRREKGETEIRKITSHVGHKA